MHAFELRPVPLGFELRSGQVTEAMVFQENVPRPAVHLVGFLSQKDGGELRMGQRTSLPEQRRPGKIRPTKAWEIHPV